MMPPTTYAKEEFIFTDSGVVESYENDVLLLDEENFYDAIDRYEYLLVNFYT